MSESQTTGPAFTFENDPQEYNAQGRRIMAFDFHVDGEQAVRCHECLSAQVNVGVKVTGESDIVTGAPDEWREKYEKLKEEHAALWLRMGRLQDGVASVKGARDEVIRERDAMKDKLGGLQKELANTGRKYRAAVEEHWEAVEELGLVKGERNKAITERDEAEKALNTAMHHRLDPARQCLTTDWIVQHSSRQDALAKLRAVLKLLGGDEGSRASDE